MRIVLILVGVLVALVGGIVFFFPMSVVAGFAAKAAPDFKFADATGSVWNGTLRGVTLGRQEIGDVKLSAKPDLILKGRMGGKATFARPDATGEGELSVGFDGKNAAWQKVKLAGRASAIPGLPARLAASQGQFSVAIAELTFRGDKCTKATGEVWTDVLSVETFENEWKGPEMRGPLKCENGELFVEAAGKAANGEDVTARLDIQSGAMLMLNARVTRVGPDGAAALSELGFHQSGNEYVLSRGL